MIHLVAVDKKDLNMYVHEKYVQRNLSEYGFWESPSDHGSRGCCSLLVPL